ncbi:WXG100 family type VII secretion target [Agromyces soli]
MGVRVRTAPARASLTQINHELSQMQAILDALELEGARLQRHWDGAARDAFAVGMRRAHASLSRLRIIASHATSEASATVEAFTQFDRKRATAWLV